MPLSQISSRGTYWEKEIITVFSVDEQLGEDPEKFIGVQMVHWVTDTQGFGKMWS